MLKACKECQHQKVCMYTKRYEVIATELRNMYGNDGYDIFSHELRCLEHKPPYHGNETQPRDYFSIERLLMG